MAVVRCPQEVVQHLLVRWEDAGHVHPRPEREQHEHAEPDAHRDEPFKAHLLGRRPDHLDVDEERVLDQFEEAAVGHQEPLETPPLVTPATVVLQHHAVEATAEVVSNEPPLGEPCKSGLAPLAGEVFEQQSLVKQLPHLWYSRLAAVLEQLVGAELEDPPSFKPSLLVGHVQRKRLLGLDDLGWTTKFPHH